MHIQNSVEKGSEVRIFPIFTLLVKAFCEETTADLTFLGKFGIVGQ